MQQYIYESMWTQELEDAIDASPAKPLVIEMFYKYGLMAYTWESHRKYNYDINNYETYHNKNSFIMTYNGMPICAVGIDDNKNYYIFSPHIQKERGSSDRDRHTFSSIKLSSLIKTIDKRKLLDDLDGDIRNHIASLVNTTSRTMETRFYNKRLDHDTDTANTIHAMLKAFFSNRNNPLDAGVEAQCKLLLDNFNKVDETNQTHLAELERMYKDFYFIYADASDGYVVSRVNGNLSYDERIDGVNVSVDYVIPTQRVRNLEDHEAFKDFGGTLTMFKVWLEEAGMAKRWDTLKDLIPIVDGYHPEFDITSHYRQPSSQYDGAFLCLPVNQK